MGVAVAGAAATATPSGGSGSDTDALAGARFSQQQGAAAQHEPALVVMGADAQANGATCAASTSTTISQI